MWLLKSRRFQLYRWMENFLKSVTSTDKSQIVKVDDLSGGSYLVAILIDGTYNSRKFIL